MGVYWNDANRSYMRSREDAARNVMLATQGASGNYGKVESASGILYYVDVNGIPAHTAGSAVAPIQTDQAMLQRLLADPSRAGVISVLRDLIRSHEFAPTPPERAALYAAIDGKKLEPAGEQIALKVINERPLKLATLLEVGVGEARLKLAKATETKIAGLEARVDTLTRKVTQLEGAVTAEKSNLSGIEDGRHRLALELGRYSMPAAHRVGLGPRGPLALQMTEMTNRMERTRAELTQEQTELEATKKELDRAKAELKMELPRRVVSRDELREVDPAFVDGLTPSAPKTAPILDIEAMAKLSGPKRAQALEAERTRVEKALANHPSSVEESTLMDRLVRLEELLTNSELGAPK